MNKNYYFVVTEEKEGKFVSYVLKINGMTNLARKFDKFETVIICATKKDAEETAKCFNECDKETEELRRRSPRLESAVDKLIDGTNKREPRIIGEWSKEK